MLSTHDRHANEADNAKERALKIVDVRVVLLSHPYTGKDGLEWIGGFISSWDAALIEVTTDEGITGLGEVAQGIMGAAAVPGLVDAFKPYLIGKDPLRVTERRDSLYNQTIFWARGGISSGVIGGIEMALWDIAGKTRNLPVFELLGGLAHERLPLYASGGLGTTVDEIVDFSCRSVRIGLKAVKVRGIRTPDDSIAVARAVSDAVGSDHTFVLDAVQGCASTPWPVKTALRVGEAIQELPNLLWFEEPCRAENVRGYAELKRRLKVPISGIESYSLRHEFVHLLDQDAVDIVQPDSGMVGGISEVKRILAMAESRAVPAILHTWGSAVVLMANLHTSFASPAVSMFEYCQIPNPLREILQIEPLRIEDGCALPPTAAGLGVHLTPEIERDYPFLPGRGHVMY